MRLSNLVAMTAIVIRSLLSDSFIEVIKDKFNIVDLKIDIF